MRISVIACVVLASRVAAADPLSFKLAGAVDVGAKPTLSITAGEPVGSIKLELDRSDGKHFSLAGAALEKGKTLTFEIGDGAAGKADYKGTLSCVVAGGKRWTEDLTFSTLVRGAALKVAYDADHLDLDKRVLQFKPSRAASSAELVVFGEDGRELGTGAATYTSAPSDGWFAVSWTQAKVAPVMTMKLRVVAGDGAATNVELIPWSVNVDHQDIQFKTDSSKVESTETAKLDASLAKIIEVVKRGEKFMKMRLYIAGHTDTVGPSAKNRKLSLARAVAIGTYFKKQGLKIPISIAGLGEEVLKVKTADNTDEITNRRADYVLGPAAGAPPFKGPYLKVRADWKQLR